MKFTAQREHGEIDDFVRRAHIRIGLEDDVPGMSFVNGAGIRGGFHVDIGRALASVLFVDPDAIEFVLTTPNEAFDRLRDGSIDIGLYNLSYSFLAEMSNDVVFPIPTLIDGDAALVRRSAGIQSIKELAAPRIAMQRHRATRENIDNFLAGSSYCRLEYPTLRDAVVGYRSGEADIFVAGGLVLAALLPGFSDREAHLVLGERISRQIIGPVLLKQHFDLARVVRWTVHAMMLAEELGIGSDSFAGNNSARNSRAAEVFLDLGIALNLGDFRASERLIQLLRSVGNYGEVFERNLGRESPFHLIRGANALFAAGAVYFPPPGN
jgi:general L-amino acid transport system substrate-binding protein